MNALKKWNYQIKAGNENAVRSRGKRIKPPTGLIDPHTDVDNVVLRTLRYGDNADTGRSRWRS